MNSTLLKTTGRCFACPIACKRVVEAESPYLLSSQFGGPDARLLPRLVQTVGLVV